MRIFIVYPVSRAPLSTIGRCQISGNKHESEEEAEQTVGDSSPDYVSVLRSYTPASCPCTANQYQAEDARISQHVYDSKQKGRNKATFQPFHLSKESKINLLNKTSCPNPLSVQKNELYTTAYHEARSGEGLKSVTMNLANKAATTEATEFARLGSSPSLVNPISANDLLLCFVTAIEHAT